MAESAPKAHLQENAAPWRPRRAGDHGDDRVRALVDEAKGVLALVLKEGPRLYERARKIPVVGFPPSSEPGVIGGGGHSDRVGTLAAAQVDAERRHPFVDRGDRRCVECGYVEKPDLADAEGEAIDPHGPPAATADPVLRAWYVMWDELNKARNALIRAERAVVSTLRPETRVAYRATSGGGAEVIASGDELAKPMNLWCENCRRFGFQWPARVGGRCRPCRDHQYAHGGTDAPEAMVRARYDRRERADDKRLA